MTWRRPAWIASVSSGISCVTGIILSLQERLKHVWVVLSATADLINVDHKVDNNAIKATVADIRTGTVTVRTNTVNTTNDKGGRDPRSSGSFNELASVRFTAHFYLTHERHRQHFKPTLINPPESLSPAEESGRTLVPLERQSVPSKLLVAAGAYRKKSQSAHHGKHEGKNQERAGANYRSDGDAPRINGPTSSPGRITRAGLPATS
ncbi:hypothetical protein B0H19DRAFT_1063443 [Mycena capillaripes]|nr:hypothetical protein B0H19DRAFT_1063443 [Mycena capillaripes]